MSFAKKISIIIGKNKTKRFSSQYSQKLLDHAKQPASDELENTLKRTIKKTGEETDDLISNGNADKIT